MTTTPKSDLFIVLTFSLFLFAFRASATVVFVDDFYHGPSGVHFSPEAIAELMSKGDIIITDQFGDLAKNPNKRLTVPLSSVAKGVQSPGRIISVALPDNWDEFMLLYRPVGAGNNEYSALSPVIYKKSVVSNNSAVPKKVQVAAFSGVQGALYIPRVDINGAPIEASLDLVSYEKAKIVGDCFERNATTKKQQTRDKCVNSRDIRLRTVGRITQLLSVIAQELVDVEAESKKASVEYQAAASKVVVLQQLSGSSADNSTNDTIKELLEQNKKDMEAAKTYVALLDSMAKNARAAADELTEARDKLEVAGGAKEFDAAKAQIQATVEDLLRATGTRPAEH